MKIFRWKRKYNLVALFIALAFAVTLTCVTTGAYVSQGYAIEIGKVSPKKFKAPRQTENEVATNRLRQIAEDNAVPLYRQDTEVDKKVFGQLDVFFDEISKKRAEYMPILDPTAGSISSGVISMDKSGLGIDITDEQLRYLVKMGSAEYIIFCDAINKSTEDALKAGIKEETLSKNLLAVKDEITGLGWNNPDVILAFEIISSVLKPNLLVDADATEKLRTEASEKVEPIYVQAGQTIVDEGIPISEEAYYMLKSLGYVDRGFAESIIPIAGASIFVILVFCVGIVYLCFFHAKRFNGIKDVALLFTLYVLTIGLSRVFVGFPFYFAPVVLFAVLVSVLIDFRPALVLTACATIVAALVYSGDKSFIMYFMINGILACITARYILSRNKVFTVSLLMTVSSALTVVAIYFLFEKGYSKEMLDSLVYAVLSTLLTVIVSLGTLPFWEVVFGVVTPVKLLDLTNPNRPILRRLIIEAPGTYHHSLIVANLAETAAFDIGANHILARVGAYYHDIGKLKYPQYFSENQVSDNPHDLMTPYESVQVITSHVDYGLIFADEYKLPQLIKDFIEQHQGTTVIKYFLAKAQTDSPGVYINPDDFRYTHRIPQSRETAIVMLADTVEAAVRSMIPDGKTTSEVETFVRMLIKDKLDDNQLQDSGLVIKDLDTIAKSFMRVFKGMYHERIPYPKETTKELTKK